MFEPGTKVIRRDHPLHNKKWPENLFNVPVKVTKTSLNGKRIWFDHPHLENKLGWVASRFIKESDPEFKPLSRFL